MYVGGKGCFAADVTDLSAVADKNSFAIRFLQ